MAATTRMAASNSLQTSRCFGFSIRTGCSRFARHDAGLDDYPLPAPNATQFDRIPARPRLHPLGVDHSQQAPVRLPVGDVVIVIGAGPFITMRDVEFSVVAV